MYDPQQDTMLQYQNMARKLRWTPEKRKGEHRRLEDALVKQFSLAFEKLGNDGLESWQMVCRVADRHSEDRDVVPDTVRRCRKVSYLILIFI
jgi:hypothetical protein